MAGKRRGIDAQVNLLSLGFERVCLICCFASVKLSQHGNSE